MIYFFCFSRLVRSKILKMGGYVTSCELSIIFLNTRRCNCGDAKQTVAD